VRPPESWQSARVTLVIGAVTAAAWAIAALFNINDLAMIWGGFIPARVAGVRGDEVLAPLILTPLTATLVHAGFVHLAFNLVIQLFCGRSIETIIGGRGMIILYLVGAYAAAAAQYAVHPHEVTPMVGASGPISAVLGVYAIMFGRNRVKVDHPGLALWLHALWLAAAWIGLQLLLGFTFQSGGGRIAIAAHIGGFLTGLLLAKPLLLLRYRGA
jgi:membrane associated rhomboid family serine protease